METDFSWNLSKILSQQGPYAAIILNAPIVGDETRLLAFWRNASYRVTVDGGTERWKDFVGSRNGVPDPDLICGDFDSVSQETLDYFKSRGFSSIVNTPDQDYTDFTKCLMEIKKKRPELRLFLAFLQHSGRLDQIFGNIETLFHAQTLLGLDSSLYLLENDSISWLLRPGKHLIRYPPNNKSKNYVGLIPIGAPVQSCTSTGLRWNLNNQELAFGKLVSTSNEFDGSGESALSTSGNILLTVNGMGL